MAQSGTGYEILSKISHILIELKWLVIMNEN